MTTNSPLSVTIIGTHNGQAHADEALACAIIIAVSPEEVTIVRSRNPEVLKGCKILVDVGDTYDPKADKFDHHQRENKPAPRDNGVPYSSAGLVWKHYGLFVCDGDKEVHAEVDRLFIQPIDALDNGVELVKDPGLVFKGILPLSLSAVGDFFSPTDLEDPSTADETFRGLVLVMNAILIRAVAYAKARVAAREKVMHAIKTANDRVVIIPQVGLPWEEAIIEHTTADNALFVVFPSSTPGEFMVQQIPVELGSFQGRKSLPASWAGKRGEALAAETGVSTALFCHNGRFIGGATTLEGAIALARLAVAAKE